MYKLRASMSISAEIARLKYFLALQDEKVPEFFIIKKDRIIAKITTNDADVLIALLKSGYTLDHIGD